MNISPILKKMEHLFYLEHEQFVLIVPVLIAIGIGSYFSGIVELDSFYSVLVLCISFVFFMLSRHRISSDCIGITDGALTSEI